MEERISALDIEFISIEEAMQMGRAPRMDPSIYERYERTIKELVENEDRAAVMQIPEGINYQTMKNRLLRVAKDLRVELTIRKSRKGIMVWKAKPEELTAKEEIVNRLQGGRKGRPAGRKRT